MQRYPAKRSIIGVIAGVLSCAAGSPAVAQTPPPGQPATPPEVMEPPGENMIPSPDSGPGGDNPKEPLSKQLEEGEGVLEPPRGMDPGIKKPIPDEFEGKTPVIPPPGPHGNNPDVEPR